MIPFNMEDTQQTDQLGDFDDTDWGDVDLILPNEKAQVDMEAEMQAEMQADTTIWEEIGDAQTGAQTGETGAPSAAKPRGKYLCSCGKRKYRCKVCGGSALCPHGKVKSDCQECTPSCPHGYTKRNCKDCNPQRICPHGYSKRNCKDCNPQRLCLHGCFKSRCSKCRQASLKKTDAREGGGAAKERKVYPSTWLSKLKCDHKPAKELCVICSPHLACTEHNKIRSKCKICKPAKVPRVPKQAKKACW